MARTPRPAARRAFAVAWCPVLMFSALTNPSCTPEDVAMLRPILATLFSLPMAAQAGTIDLTSPDGSVRFRLATDTEGHLLYSVTQGGQARLMSGVRRLSESGSLAAQKGPESFSPRRGKARILRGCQVTRAPALRVSPGTSVSPSVSCWVLSSGNDC